MWLQNYARHVLRPHPQIKPRQGYVRLAVDVRWWMNAWVSHIIHEAWLLVVTNQHFSLQSPKKESRMDRPCEESSFRQTVASSRVVKCCHVQTWPVPNYLGNPCHHNCEIIAFYLLCYSLVAIAPFNVQSRSYSCCFLSIANVTAHWLAVHRLTDTHS